MTFAQFLRFTLTLPLAGAASLAAQESQTTSTNLLQNLNPANQTISGQWAMNGEELTVAASTAARIEIARNVSRNYSLTVEFTRTAGDDSVGVILPIGNVSPALELSAWQGAAHGLSRVNGLPVKDKANPTASFPGTLESGAKYELTVTVATTDDSASVRAAINKKEIFNWNGKLSQLEPNFVMNLPSSGTIGLAAQNSEVTFHKITLESKAAPTNPTPPVPKPTSPSSAASGSIDLSTLSKEKTPGWEPFNGAQFTSDGDILASIPNTGTGDRGAFLKEVTFSEGIIEVDLKGTKEPQSSFIGIVFHGVDGDTYDSIYFRPFNFGSNDATRRGHAVQYISHPEWPWQKLRQQRPEQFENPVSPEPKPEDWFRARIEVASGDVKVFVNDAKTPSLAVDKLSSITNGKVGLWFNGNASFKNLKITPR